MNTFVDITFSTQEVFMV